MSAPASLVAIGWPPELALPSNQPDERIVRVIAQHRNGFLVHDGGRSLRAVAARGCVEDGQGGSIRPGVGDWMMADLGDPATLKRLLPRRNVLRRAAAGEHLREQLLAANVDVAIIVMGLDGDFNPRRLERYLALVRSAGIPAVVVLSKADRCPDAATLRDSVLGMAGESPVLAINSKDPSEVTAIGVLLGPGQTGILLGSSGAGKSTLSNTLIGEIKQKTGDVRAHDSRGRHTTTVRSLLMLPTGGCLIDSPGMRELKLTGEESLEDEQFADIAALAERCRFNDCRHEREPGCAVRAAIEAGELDEDRLAHYWKLAGERDAAAAVRLERQRKAEEKILSRALNHRLIDKYGRR